MSDKKQDMCVHCLDVKDITKGIYTHDDQFDCDLFECLDCINEKSQIKVVKCDLCGNLFSEENIISVTYKDGHKSNLCERCDDFIDHFNELGFEYPVTPEHIKDVLARYPAEDPRTDDFDMSKLLHKHTPDEPRTDVVDIHKIIDDAMAKGDRSVSIMMHNGITSVEVRPYKEEKTQWLYNEIKDYVWCSNCGYRDSGCNRSTYCPNCGEFMHDIRKVNIEEND